MAPENTLAAFRKAVEMGADWIELDVRFTADLRLAVIHDAGLRRTTDGRGRVRDHSLDQLSRLDAGSWFGPQFVGERIPSLPEVIRQFRDTGLGLLIEIKSDAADPPDAAERVLAEVEGVSDDRCILQSFNLELVSELSRISPRIPTAALVENRRPDPVQATLTAGSRWLAVKWKLLRKHLLEEARRKEIGVLVWTLNREREFKRALNRQVDGIITNHPDRLRKLIRYQIC